VQFIKLKFGSTERTIAKKVVFHRKSNQGLGASRKKRGSFFKGNAEKELPDWELSSCVRRGGEKPLWMVRGSPPSFGEKKKRDPREGKPRGAQGGGQPEGHGLFVRLREERKGGVSIFCGRLLDAGSRSFLL